MEWYDSQCPDCGARYQWVGSKTGWGKTEEQRAKMRRDKTVCRECGSENLKTGLDHTSPEARDMDETLGSILGAILGPKRDGA